LAILGSAEKTLASKSPYSASTVVKVVLGSDEASDAIFDKAGADVNTETDDLNIEILRVWDANGDELDPDTGESCPHRTPRAASNLKCSTPDAPVR
jgi:hypothetical protein